MKVECADATEGRYLLIDGSSRIDFFPGTHPSGRGEAVYWSSNGAVFYFEPIVGDDVHGSVRAVAERFCNFRKIYRNRFDKL